MFWPAYWICNSKFRQLDDGRFLISDPKNPYIPIFSKKIGIFFLNFARYIESAILNFSNLIADL